MIGAIAVKSAINEILTISIVFFLTGFLSADPANPVGTGREPSSSGRSEGLRRTPNPIDSSSNDIITGNIAGDKYFRGSVPYGSTTDFGGTSESTSLDNFLRRSASSSTYDYNTGKYKPYYSTSGSVATIRPGRSTVFSAPRVDFSGKSATGIIATDAEPTFMKINPDLQLFSNQIRPIEPSYLEIKRKIDEDLDTRYKNIKTEEIQPDTKPKEKDSEFKEFDDQIETLKMKLAEKQSTDLDKFTKETEKNLNVEKLSETEMLAAKAANNEQLDVYDQMRMEIAGLGQMLRAKQLITEKETLTPEQIVEEAKKNPSPEKVVVEALTLKSFAAFKDDNFNKYMKLAETYLKEGKYYRASNAYSLAEIYKPNDPLVYAGNSQALFAAGEFMSSAYNLLQAVNIFPEIVKIKIDIIAIIGDKDVVESRASDVEELIKDFDSVELKYLLSYVYFQMGRLERAKELIDDAYKTNPDLQIIKLIQFEIYEALK